MFNLYIAPRQAIITFQNRISLSRYKPRELQNKDPGSNDYSKIDQIDPLNDILDTVTFLPFTLQRLKKSTRIRFRSHFSESEFSRHARLVGKTEKLESFRFKLAIVFEGIVFIGRLRGWKVFSNSKLSSFSIFPTSF